MTDKVNPSINRPAEAFKTAGAIALAGGNETGYIRPATNPSEISVQDEGITEGNLNAFQTTTSASSYDVTVDGGEAFIFGSWLAIDTQTTVTLAAGTADQTVYVGWNKDGTDDVIIGLQTDFDNDSGNTDQKIPIATFDTDGSGVSDETDERKVTDSTGASGSGVHPRVLGSGENLTVETGESLVVAQDYTVNGDLDVQGEMAIVDDTPSHDVLTDVDPHDHLKLLDVKNITAASGSTPAFDAELVDVADGETTAWDLVVSPRANTDVGRYAFNVSHNKIWADGQWNSEVTINWDEDPGSDVPLEVEVNQR